MKKLSAIFLLFVAVWSYAQCSINGKSTINIKDTETYSIETNIAQCRECHLWVTVGGNAKIEGDNRLHTVKLKANSGGRTVLSLAYLSPVGLVQCSKNIDILDTSGNSSYTPAPNTSNNSNCDIDFKNYKEVKVSPNIVSFFPNVGADTDFSYTWTANYRNGDWKTSNEKVPQFPFSEENPILNVKIKVISKTCYKEFSKTYEGNFWKFF